MVSAGLDAASWRCGFWARCSRRRTRICVQRIRQTAGGFQWPRASRWIRSRAIRCCKSAKSRRSNTEPWKGWNENPKIISATEWLANVMMNPAVADTWPVFRVDNPDLITLLKLPEKNAAQHQDGKHYSWNQIAPSLRIVRQGKRARRNKSTSASRNAYEHAVIKVHERLMLYAQLKNTSSRRTRRTGSRNWPIMRN